MKSRASILVVAVVLLALQPLLLTSTEAHGAGVGGEEDPTRTTAPPGRSRFLTASEPWKQHPAAPPYKAGRAKCDKKTGPQVCRNNNPGMAAAGCCGGKCVDTAADVFHCGSCNKVCRYTEKCCGGKCVNLNFDKRHCGVCANKCGNGILCIYGMCNYA